MSNLGTSQLIELAYQGASFGRILEELAKLSQVAADAEVQVSQDSPRTRALIRLTTDLFKASATAKEYKL